MNIIGIGLDATDIPRIQEVFGRFGDRFLRRVFTDAEIAYCVKRRDPSPHLAARFAAKEAAMKALGTGHSHGIFWKDIEVIRHHGPPRLQFHAASAARLTFIGANASLLTITHSEMLAIAQVLLLAR